jgi:hypothetical protein
MSEYFYIAGVNRISNVLLSGISIEQELTQRIDSASFRVKGFQPNEGDEIIIESDILGRLFGGVIDVVEFEDKVNGINVYTVQCQDFTYKLDAKLVIETYENITADVIIRDIINKYCPGFTVNNVKTGAPRIEYITFNYERPSEVFKKIADYVGWDWYIDYYKDVWFFNPSEINMPAPVKITPNINFRNFKYTIETQGLRNRVYVRGGTMLSDFYTYEIKADGVARTWILPHKPHEISMRVGGVAKSVGVENVGDETNFDYMLNFQEKYIKASEQTGIIPEGTTISWTYKYDIDVITMVEDISSQEAVARIQTDTDGVYEHVIVDDSLVTIEAAEAAGNADLKEHANPRVKGSFDTEVTGWTPGQLVEIDLPGRGIRGVFLVQKVSLSPLIDKKWTYHVEYGGRLLGISDTLKALVSSQQQRDRNETEVLHKFSYAQEKANIADEITSTERRLPFKFGDPDAIVGFVEVSAG